MKSFKSFLSEEITQGELKSLEVQLDKLFSYIGVDIEFTKHFKDRMNDPRNKKPITIPELKSMFDKTFDKYEDDISGENNKGLQAVINDINTKINVPFVLSWNNRKKEIVLTSKTIMRKADFKTSNQKLRV